MYLADILKCATDWWRGFWNTNPISWLQTKHVCVGVPSPGEFSIFTI